MTAPEDNQLENTIACPVCDGMGQVKESYPYKTQHKYDAGGQVIVHSELCWFCGGEHGGLITPGQFEMWKALEAQPVCPLCNGTGGNRSWRWQETEKGSRKEFSYTPCRLCHGKRYVSQEQIYAHEREKQQLRFWGIGCTALFVVVAIVGATQLLTALLNGTPWFRCCPAPGLIPIGVVVLHFVTRNSPFSPH